MHHRASSHTLVASALGRCCVAAVVIAAAATVQVARADDDCELGGKSPTYVSRMDSGYLAAPNAGQILSIEFGPLPRHSSNIRYRLEVSSDLGLASEFYYARVNGEAWDAITVGSESDCADPPQCSNWALDQLSGYAWTGNEHPQGLQFELLASPNVNAGQCPDGFVRLVLEMDVYVDDDCNNNRRHDHCDIADGLLTDCDQNGWADECQIARIPETDCNGNGLLDCCEAQLGARDCDHNFVLDACEIASNAALDCNDNAMLDVCEIAVGMVSDVNRNRIPDACDIASSTLADCDQNGIADLIDMEDPARDLDGDRVLDSCAGRNPDLVVDGLVNSADLAYLLNFWGTANFNADLSGNGMVNAEDLTLLLAGWGTVGLCGDGVRNARENCCNCPQDAGCGEAFDCYYGACMPCTNGNCPPKFDECNLFYGDAPLYYGSNPTYGIDYMPCYGLPQEPLWCATLFAAPSTTPRFAMRIVDGTRAGTNVVIASLSVLMMVAIPRNSVRRLLALLPRRSSQGQPQVQPRATTQSNTNL